MKIIYITLLLFSMMVGCRSYEVYDEIEIVQLSEKRFANDLWVEKVPNGMILYGNVVIPYRLGLKSSKFRVVLRDSQNKILTEKIVRLKLSFRVGKIRKKQIRKYFKVFLPFSPDAGKIELYF